MATVFTVEKAYKMNKAGFDVHYGWFVMCDGNWGNTYRTKRDALAAIEEAKKEEAENE